MIVLGFFAISSLLAMMALGRRPTFDINKLVTFDETNCKRNIIGLDGPIDQRANLQDAFGDAIIIAHAGVLAAATPNKPPFNYFFHPTDNETVVQSLQMVIDLTENVASFGSAHIAMDCNNIRWCKLRNQWGYTQIWSPTAKWWEVTICDYALDTLQRNPPACSGSPGLPSLGWVGLKYLLQMWDIRAKIGVVGNYAFGPADCHALLAKDRGDPQWNAENYAYMSSWAYDLGLKQDGPYFGAPCPQNWNPNPAVILPPWARAGTTDRHSGLD